MNLTFDVPAYALKYDRSLVRSVYRSVAKEIMQQAQSEILNQTPPSKPGQAPANRTGELANDFLIKPGRDSQNEISYRVVNTNKAATSLETGAVGGGGVKGNRNKRGKPSTQRVLEPRPYFEIALASKTASLETRVAAAFANGLKLEKVK